MPLQTHATEDTVTETSAVVQRVDSFSHDDLLRCARGELFGPGNAQLPLPPMLMFDRITHISYPGGLFGRG
jgi:3-hydroxyacyl-[acyl-carrier protein] dehydratase/trans-2-decenoyl-[acyl-carrier protein] isomerase